MTIDPTDRARLFRELCRMPYAGGIVPRLQDLDVDRLVSTLAALAERLAEHAQDCRRRDDDLTEHRALIQGGRRLLAALLHADPSTPPVPGGSAATSLERSTLSNTGPIAGP